MSSKLAITQLKVAKKCAVAANIGVGWRINIDVANICAGVTIMSSELTITQLKVAKKCAVAANKY